MEGFSDVMGFLATIFIFGFAVTGVVLLCYFVYQSGINNRRTLEKRASVEERVDILKRQEEEKALELKKALKEIGQG